MPTDIKDPLDGDYEAACTHPGCGWTNKFRMQANLLNTGDSIPRDPTNGEFGKCRKCKRHSLTVTKVPARVLTTPGHPGFWKVPTE
jgi:hypothetical protein